MGMNEEQAVVTIKGEVDIYSVDQFRKSIEKSINQKTSKIILDCTDLSYIDSTGMGVHIEMRNKTMEMGQKIVMKNPKPNIKKLLSLTGVDKIIEIIEEKKSISNKKVFGKIFLYFGLLLLIYSFTFIIFISL